MFFFIPMQPSNVIVNILTEEVAHILMETPWGGRCLGLPDVVLLPRWLKGPILEAGTGWHCPSVPLAFVGRLISLRRGQMGLEWLPPKLLPDHRSPALPTVPRLAFGVASLSGLLQGHCPGPSGAQSRPCQPGVTQASLRLQLRFLCSRLLGLT